MSEQSYPSGRPNFLVTGGAGFIGSHLCKELIKKANVICVDSFITGSEDNIELLLRNPNFEFLKHDLVNPLDLNKFPELKKFEVPVQGVQEIYHLACPTSPKEFDKLPIETLLANSHATYNVLNLAINNKAKILFASTASVYGEMPEDLEEIPESYHGDVDPVGPRSAYNEGKRFAECMVETVRQKYNLDTKIARVFKTYGPRMRIDDGRMIPDWIRNAMENKKLVVHGDMHTRITMCYVTDMVDALIRLMGSSLAGPVNIGSSDVYTLEDVANKIISATESSATIEIDTAFSHHHVEGVPDTSIARRELGWIPMMKLNEGLQETIKDMELHSHYYGIDKAKIGQDFNLTKNK